MIESKDVLNWCFTIVSIDFGVFGFLYAIYISATSSPTPERPIRPGIARRVIPFCQAIASIIAVLTILSGVTAVQAAAGVEVWIIVLCLAVLAGFTVRLSWTMS